MHRVCIGIFCFLLLTCQSSETNQKNIPYLKITGQTMGTYYTITCSTTNPHQLQTDIDSLLVEINLGVNHYDSTALISQFNQTESKILLDTTSVGKHLYINLQATKAIYRSTDGALDPTVMPLVNYWGFGYTGKRAVTNIDSLKVSNLLSLVDFKNVQIINVDGKLILQKKQAGTKLDFSSIAKGYGVDKVGELLEQKGIQNYLVDIGGEVRGSGLNPKGMPWKLGISTPSTEAALTDYESVISIDNRSMATSGNYRNYYEVDGIKYAHTLNPKTGYPEKNTLLSATVLAKECMIADGFATAFMTMGIERAYTLAAATPNIEAYFLYALEDGTIGSRYTNGLEGLIMERMLDE